MTRLPPDKDAPLNSDAWFSWVLDVAEAAVREGKCVAWNTQVAARLRARWSEQPTGLSAFLARLRSV